MSFGLVLSGGSAFGLANAGVLEVFEEHKLKPDCIAGSSMGAIIAAIFALGYPTSTLHTFSKSLKLINVAKISDKFFSEGLHGGFFRQRLKQHLEDLVGDATIGDCTIPFICVAGRVKQPIKWKRIIKEGFALHVQESVEPYIFPKETYILDALMATSAIPVVFSPYEINRQTYIDLCHFGPIPARSLKATENPDIIIATDTNPSYEELRSFLPPSWNEFLEAGYEETKKSLKLCDLVIKPRMPYPPYRFDKGESFRRAGREAAKEKIDDIRRFVEKKNH